MKKLTYILLTLVFISCKSEKKDVFQESEWFPLFWATFMYKNSCGFVCEDFPKENQTLQTRNDL